MARRDQAGGCGCLIVLLAFPVLILAVTGIVMGAYAIAASLCAPVAVPYLILAKPIYFQAERGWWLLALAACPVIAYVLATARPPLTRRGQAARRRRERDVDLLDTPADRAARRWRKALQTIFLLIATNLAAVIVVSRYNDRNPTSNLTGMRNAFALVFGPLVVPVILHLIFRFWDYRYPAIGERVSLDAVQKALDEVDALSRTISAQQVELRRMTERVDREIATAERDLDFTRMRGEHRISVKLANTAHDAFESLSTSNRALAAMAVRARASTRPTLRSRRDAATGTGGRRELHAASTFLSQGWRRLSTQTHQALDVVHHLNRRTGKLRDKIRDSCGERGQQYYESVQAATARRRSQLV